MCPFSLLHVAIIRSIHAASSRPVASSCSVKNRDRTPCFLQAPKHAWYPQMTPRSRIVAWLFRCVAQSVRCWRLAVHSLQQKVLESGLDTRRISHNNNPVTNAPGVIVAHVLSSKYTINFEIFELVNVILETELFSEDNSGFCTNKKRWFSLFTQKVVRKKRTFFWGQLRILYQ